MPCLPPQEANLHSTSCPTESEQIDPPTFYNFEEGLSHLTLEGQATLERLEGMLAQSAPQPRCCMGGVDTKDSLQIGRAHV